MKLSSIFFLFFLFLSCKDKEVKKEFLKISISVKLIEDDSIKLYYILDEKGTYNERNSIEVAVKGSLDLQSVEFALKQIPYKFRIDLGDNRNKSEVHFSAVNISFKNKNITINENAIDRFFKPNIYVSLTANGYLRKEVDNRYDPFIESTALLQKKLQIEF